jgi:hypothetical protein
MTAATSSRSRWPGICSDLQPADTAPSRPVVDGREDRPSTTNKKAYSHRKPPDTPEIGFVGMDCGRTLQAVGVCRNNAKIVDNIMRDSTKRVSDGWERVRRMTRGAATRRAARVCVFTFRGCGTPGGENTQSHDGGPTAPRGRGLRPRRYRPATTTNYTLGLSCSSKGRESNVSIHNFPGGSCV